MTTSTPKPPIAPSMSGAGLRTDTPRRVVDIPGAPVRRPDAAAPPAAAAAAPQDQQRRLTVGRDISLSGEITSCDVLVVEGTVEAKLRDGRNIEIADSGLFKGSVEIDEADIAGRFEGDIVVRGRLRVRSTGKITGSIKYGELEVEAGGRLVGDIQVVEPGATVARIATPAPVELPVAAMGSVAE
ncbi:bactofilin family protein [Azospirillum oleiclasticum]|nr:polymer-forming cytoskeletal protein [Azospirillum oleiclasticum]